MSFILDALRKSEHERQRSATPGIANVPFGAPRKVLPVWAVGLIVVLGVAVLALGGAYLRSEWPAGVRQARSTSAADAPVTPPVSASRPPTAERPAPGSERPSQLAERSLARESRSIAPQTQTAPRGTSASPSSSTLVAPPSASAERADEPRLPRAAEPAGRGGPVLPSAASLEAEGIAVPKLDLQLVAFYDAPADRYVFINNAKYHEGATLAEGPRVVSITNNGAVMYYLGREFMLTQ
jgi:general secretion pathway protein B